MYRLARCRRLAPLIGGGAGGRAGGGAGGGGRGGARGGGAPGAPAGDAPAFTSMFPAPAPNTFKPNDWNRFETLVDADIFHFGVNLGSNGLSAANGLQVATDGKGGNFGPVALYVGGSGEVRFKDLAIKDLNLRLTPTEKSGGRFRAQKIEDFYYGWSMARRLQSRRQSRRDDRQPVLPGAEVRGVARIYLGQPHNPAKEYAPAMVNFAADYTGDGGTTSWP